jgi:hypothetical protein
MRRYCTMFASTPNTLFRLCCSPHTLLPVPVSNLHPQTVIFSPLYDRLELLIMSHLRWSTFGASIYGISRAGERGGGTQVRLRGNAGKQWVQAPAPSLELIPRRKSSRSLHRSSASSFSCSCSFSSSSTTRRSNKLIHSTIWQCSLSGQLVFHQTCRNIRTLEHSQLKEGAESRCPRIAVCIAP